MASPTFTGAGTAISVVVGIAAAILGLIVWNVAGTGALAVVVRFIAIGLFALTLVSVASLVAVRSPPMVERLTGWKYPTLEFSPWPIELGSRVGVTYRRQPAKARTLTEAVGSIEVEAEITCEEWVQYTVGTDTRTESHDVVEIELTEPARLTDQGIEATFWFTIPTEHGAPTLDLRNNKIRWRIENEIEKPFGRRTKTSVGFTVAPTLDRDAVVGEGRLGEGNRT